MYSELDKCIMKFMNEEILKKDASAEKKQALAEEVIGRYEGIKQLCTTGSVFIALDGKKTVMDYENYQSQFMEEDGCLLIALINCFFRFHGQEDKDARMICRVAVVDGCAGYKLSVLSSEGAKKFRKCYGKENIKSLCHGCLKDTRLDILKKCGTCKRVSYCSRECQKADWKEHKPKCCAAH